MMATIMVKAWGAAWAPSDGEGYSMGANGQSAIRKVPTAYGDGLWGLQNTDIRCARINHHGSVNSFFDGPLGLWILNGSFAYQEYVTLCSSLSNEAG